MEKEQKFLDALEEDLRNADMSEADRSRVMKNVLYLKKQKINLMITGATGCGKSSTINALFNMEVAKVGVGVDPETMDIQKYELENLVLWDSPGLGDGKEADKRHSNNIIQKLKEKDEQGKYLIDLVLVILDGSTRDLGTSYELINNVIIPNLGEDKQNRILVAINQADVAMKGRYWDYKYNKPEDQLVKFLDEKVLSVKKRIKDGTGIDVDPIYYSAGFKEEGMAQCQPYNLTKLLYYIIKYTPEEKRLAYIENLNKDEDSWNNNDDRGNYQKGIIENIGETIFECALEGAERGRDMGAIFGHAGEVLGQKIGTTIGMVYGTGKALVETITKPFKSRGKGCYITTATCEEYGKPDDCYELTAFRGFRDNWLQYQKDGKELIQRYYDTAPEIVELINVQPNRKEIYQRLNEQYLSKCLSYIEAGENEKCKETYVDMMEYLYSEERKWKQ